MENKVDIITIRTSNKFKFKCGKFTFKDAKNEDVVVDTVEKDVDFDKEALFFHGNMMISFINDIITATTVNDNKDAIRVVFGDGDENINGTTVSFDALDVIDISINKPDERATMKFVQKMYDGDDVTDIGRFIFNSMKVGDYPELDENLPAKVNFYVHLVNLYVSPTFSILKKK